MISHKLYDFIPKQEFIPIDCYLIEEIPVPTEMVITEPKLAVPQYARVYRTGQYILNDEIVEYHTLAKIPNFKGTNNYDEILLVEVWLDNGDDGHTIFSHEGFRFITKSQFEKEKTTERHYVGQLPQCMYWYYKNQEYPI